MWVTLGYQLGYQHLKDLIDLIVLHLGLHMGAIQNYFMTE